MKIKGYQPDPKNPPLTDPPKGGSGLPSKAPTNSPKTPVSYVKKVLNQEDEIKDNKMEDEKNYFIGQQ